MIAFLSSSLSPNYLLDPSARGLVTGCGGGAREGVVIWMDVGTETVGEVIEEVLEGLVAVPTCSKLFLNCMTFDLAFSAFLKARAANTVSPN